jgi:hypothetical protein
VPLFDSRITRNAIPEPGPDEPVEHAVAGGILNEDPVACAADFPLDRNAVTASDIASLEVRIPTLEQRMGAIRPRRPMLLTIV